MERHPCEALRSTLTLPFRKGNPCPMKAPNAEAVGIALPAQAQEVIDRGLSSLLSMLQLSVWLKEHIFRMEGVSFASVCLLHLMLVLKPAE